MKEIVINKCWGGFGLSPEAERMLAELQGKRVFYYRQTKYKHQDGKDEYTRTSTPEKFMAYALTKDLGEVVNDLPNDSEFWFNSREIARDDPNLIKVIKSLKNKADGEFAELKIIKIPEDIEWEIDEYDGIETVEEQHRSWG